MSDLNCLYLLSLECAVPPVIPRCEMSPKCHKRRSFSVHVKCCECWQAEFGRITQEHGIGYESSSEHYESREDVCGLRNPIGHQPTSKPRRRRYKHE